MTQRTKRFIVLLAVNMMLFSIGIVVLECIFGDWIKQDNLNKLNIIRSQTRTYYIDGLYDSPQKTVTYTRDQYGLRGQFNHPGEIVILTVGGSTTDQRYISDGQTWQDVLQQEFQSIDKEIIVANAGVDGQSTFGHIKNFAWWFPKIPGLKAKFVIFYIGLNDFYKDEGYGYDALLKEKKGRAFRQLIREKSAIYHLLNTLHGIYEAEIKHRIGHRTVDFTKLEWVSNPLQSCYDELMANRLREYAERLEVLIQKAKEADLIPIFVTQPSRQYRYRNGQIKGVKDEFSYDGVSINGVDHFYMKRKLDEVTKSVSKKHNVLYLDLAKETFWEDADFYDFVHLVPSGTRKLGKFLFKALREYVIINIEQDASPARNSAALDYDNG